MFSVNFIRGKKLSKQKSDFQGGTVSTKGKKTFWNLSLSSSKRLVQTTVTRLGSVPCSYKGTLLKFHIPV